MRGRAIPCLSTPARSARPWSTEGVPTVALDFEQVFDIYDALIEDIGSRPLWLVAPDVPPVRMPDGTMRTFPRETSELQGRYDYRIGALMQAAHVIVPVHVTYDDHGPVGAAFTAELIQRRARGSQER